MTRVRFFDGEAVREGALVVADGTVRLLDRPATSDTPLLDGLVTGRFTDHHVHLQLVDHTLLPASRLGRVIDLGATLEWIRAAPSRMETAGDTASAPTESIRAAPPRMENAGETASTPAESIRGLTGTAQRMPIIEYAGPFLTAPGGYPADRAWAPDGSVREVADERAARAVVAELAAAGVSTIKIVANSDAGPVLSDELVRSLVRLAAEHGVGLVGHAEGAGQAQRLARLGVPRLAHAPFSERLSNDEISAQAASVEWISTLAIHEGEQRAIAVDNVRRFVAAGGTVLYGTDMGNGDTPVDLREDEIAALRGTGFDGIRLLHALAPLSPLDADAPLLFLPAGDPARARPLIPADLEA
ncbi:hydrolase [Microbacterium sp. YJN-G]|uniref:hydrolase n=1 Tax=Microbacterium sp. YJN-G TaxID=2763257 RepID=UPI001878B809|nr:hydrolase [Microbacterium sp. YJN-G]